MCSKEGLVGLLALCLLVNFTAANVYILKSGYILDPLPDIPADFGPDIPDVGVEGALRCMDPEDACSPSNFTDFSTPWIALIARQQQLHPNNCTFDIKVWNAQNAGAIAAIVYDDVYESLIIMSKPKGHPDPEIPSVFVSQKAGFIMKKLVNSELVPIHVTITPLSSVAWLSMLMSAFLGVLALGVVLATFYVMRSWSMWLTGMHVRGGGPGGGGPAAQTQQGQARPTQQQESGLPPESLRLLPVLVFEAPVPFRSSRPASGLPSGAPTSSLASETDSLSRAATALGAAVWIAEDVAAEGEEELRPLLGEGDVEEGCGQVQMNGEEYEESQEVVYEASRSSSESGGCWPVAGALPHLPRPHGAHAGETKRVCAICFEGYVEGDKIRVLPCAHRFHMGCVDQWLGSHRSCPVCKHDASQPLPHPPDSRSSGAGAGGSGRGVASGQINGWSLLFHGLIDLLRHPRVIPNQRRRAAVNVAQQQRQRLRSLRQQQPSPHITTTAAPELQEPMVSPGPAPSATPASVSIAAAAAAPALDGDVQARGPSAVAGSTSGDGGGSAGLSAPIAFSSSSRATITSGAMSQQQLNPL